MGIIVMDSTPPARITSALPDMMRSAAIAIDCRPEEQKRLMVIAEHSTGRPARNDAIRATFIPCSASGMAQPRITSSISLASSCGTRASAPLMATAAISSGRVARSPPLYARPTGVRTALAITTSLIIKPLKPQKLFATEDTEEHRGRTSNCYFASVRLCVLCGEFFRLIPQGLPRLQRVLNPLLRLLLTTQRLERLPLQIEQILFTHWSSRRDIPATEHLRNFAPDLHFMIAYVLALPHEMNPKLQRRQDALAGSGNIGSHYWRTVAFLHQFESATLGVGEQAFAVHSDHVSF